jgi:predicted Rossmann fold nucleotide-binding protein DprA/Smf involved in DNA uptake
MPDGQFCFDVAFLGSFQLFILDGFQVFFWELLMEAPSENWKKLQKIEKSFRKLEKASENLKKLRKIGKSFQKVGKSFQKIGKSFRKLEKALENWKKL